MTLLPYPVLGQGNLYLDRVTPVLGQHFNHYKSTLLPFLNLVQHLISIIYPSINLIPWETFILMSPIGVIMQNAFLYNLVCQEDFVFLL